MRLLRTGPYKPGCEKFKLIEKFGSQIPPYAILSHRCGDDDVHYEDVRDPSTYERRLYVNNSGMTLEDIRDQSVRERKGYSKVVGAMRQAASNGYEYIWIDTCCIDKSNSAELSEGINSMYAWYQKAEICYVILDEVPGRDAANFETEFKACDWFERGWTLQELLVPKDVIFFGRLSKGTWNMLGNRRSLQDLISSRTGIPTEYLAGPGNLRTANIAQKMSWVAERKTTKPEDIAYCLLGLFSVNMPLIYGEGHRAFIRLQEEIVKISDDQSIFAWMHSPAQHDLECGFERPVNHGCLKKPGLRKTQISGPIPETRVWWEDVASHGLLADSPKAFLKSGEVRSLPIFFGKLVPYYMTNRGLSISLNLRPMSKHPLETSFLAEIGCCRLPPPDDEGVPDAMTHVCVYLRRISHPSANQFTRIRCEKLVSITEKDRSTLESAESTDIFVARGRNNRSLHDLLCSTLCMCR